MADAKVFRMGSSQTLEEVAHALEDFLRGQKHLETELAAMLIRGQLSDGQLVRIGYGDGRLSFQTEG